MDKDYNFGVIGNPIKHSISPILHEFFYEKTKFSGKYKAYCISEKELENTILKMSEHKILGYNITVPYKVKVMEYLEEIDEMAKLIGAVNTVARKEKLIGYNTDWQGIGKACKYYNIPIEGKDIVIIGAGGAARATAFMCVYFGANSIHIMNRTVSKAKIIIDNIKDSNYNETYLSYGSLRDYSKLTRNMICFQTTSAGMSPNIEESAIEDKEFFGYIEFIMDIVYNPSETKFMKLGKAEGIKAYNGLAMLFFQGLYAFNIWTGKQLDEKYNDAGIEFLKDRL